VPLSAGHDVIEKDLHADPDQDEASRHLHPLPEDRAQPLPKEEQIVETSGAIWVETFKAPIVNLRMEVTGTTGLARDITQRKRAEEEKRSLEERLNRAEKMEALGVLAGSVAHDLNNVLGVIVGYSELLQHSEDKSSAIQPKLEAILKRSQRAAAIVEDLLTLARRGVLGKDIVNMSRIIADFLKLPEFQNLSSYHPSVQIKHDLEPYLPNISGSSVHLGKTFFNLASNGCEAMPKDIEWMTGAKVFLKQFVRVEKNWRKDSKAFERFGY